MHLLLLQRKFRPFLMKIPLIMKSLLRERYLVSILIWIFNLFMKSNSCTRDCNHVSYQAYWQTCHQLNCTNNNHYPGVNPGSEIFSGDWVLFICWNPLAFKGKYKILYKVGSQNEAKLAIARPALLWWLTALRTELNYHRPSYRWAKGPCT